MKNKFTLGVIAGMSSLALAVPLFAQVSSAATTTASTPSTTSMRIGMFKHTPLTQQQVTDMAAKDGLFLSNIDAMVTVQKSVVATHQSALTAAAAITDETQRMTAVKKAQSDMRTAIDAAITANPNLKHAMMPFGHGGGHKGFGHGGMGKANIATKLGMTDVELKAAFDSGKTIEQIATEKGVTLPMRAEGKDWMMMGKHARAQ
ncbi:MAG: hypothetical protein KBD00_06135 [Candidatus Peribacteraceae bacterium]|nr:hypothetical protein [Candidatus Peribacteraceae bacterium]